MIASLGKTRSNNKTQGFFSLWSRLWSYGVFPMFDLMHLMPWNSSDEGRLKRAKKEDAPKCKICGTRYGAASTRERVTWYRRKCQCAPPEMIKRLRPFRYTAPK
jgi:hypothetical protein